MAKKSKKEFQVIIAIVYTVIVLIAIVWGAIWAINFIGDPVEKCWKEYAKDNCNGQIIDIYDSENPMENKIDILYICSDNENIAKPIPKEVLIECASKK